MSDPDWFRPGTLVRLKPTISLEGYPATAILCGPFVREYAATRHLLYPDGLYDGSGVYVRPEHVEPVTGPERKVNFREFL